jgi:catechol 2,3-dioxygenase-like lactoylglutathione lyase family enzyme
MFAQINHMAMISPNYALLERYYRALFGFRVTSRGDHDAEASTVVGDGNVGLNILPRRDGYIGGIDHFGMVVDSIDAVQARMKGKHDKANIVKRPSTRPFAAYSGHDPDGNVFDLAERAGSNRKDVYAEAAEGGWKQPNVFHRFAIRTPNAEACAEFYADVFELQPVNRSSEEGAYHLTDGAVILSIMPWSIDWFSGTSIKRPGPDHIGIKVADLDAFRVEMDRIGGKNTFLASRPLGGSRESDARRDHFSASALGKLQIADPDGNWLDITDE